DDGRTGYLVAPGDAGAFADAVARLAGNPQLRITMGRAGRQKTISRSWRALGDELLGHYSSVLGRSWRPLPLDVPVEISRSGSSRLRTSSPLARADCAGPGGNPAPGPPRPGTSLCSSCRVPPTGTSRPRRAV